MDAREKDIKRRKVEKEAEIDFIMGMEAMGDETVLINRDFPEKRKTTSIGKTGEQNASVD